MPKENLQSTTHKLFTSRAGQSLIEVMIALAIGSLLIGAASLGIAFIIRSSTTNQKLQSASGFTGDLVDRVRSISSADWQNIYGLTKGTSTAYFVNASGTTLFFLEGKEGVLDDDVLSGLVGHWKFDETVTTTSTITYDATGNNNNGMLINGVLRASSTCQVSHCLNFDGTSDYVQISDSVLLKPSQITITFWINLSQTTIVKRVMQKGNLTGSWTITQGWSTADKKIDFGIYDGSWQNLHSNTALAEATWYHVAITYDSSKNVVIYINGNADTNTTFTKTLPQVAVQLTVGTESSAGFGTSYFNGFIDDVRIYNRALSADEINRLYGSTVFTRYFNVENVNRDSDGDIVTSGGNDDPSTQKITTYVEWPGVESAVGQVKIVDYITRWSNRVFNQTDWSGGSGEEGPVTDPGSKYSSSTGVSSQVGSIKIEGL